MQRYLNPKKLVNYATNTDNAFENSRILEDSKSAEVSLLSPTSLSYTALNIISDN